MTTTAAVYPEVQAAMMPGPQGGVESPKLDVGGSSPSPGATFTLESAYGCTWPPLAELRLHRYVGKVPLTPLLRRLLGGMQSRDEAVRAALTIEGEYVKLRMRAELVDWFQGKRGHAARTDLFRFRARFPEFRLAGPRGRLP